MVILFSELIDSRPYNIALEKRLRIPATCEYHRNNNNHTAILAALSCVIRILQLGRLGLQTLPLILDLLLVIELVFQLPAFFLQQPTSQLPFHHNNNNTTKKRLQLEDDFLAAISRPRAIGLRLLGNFATTFWSSIILTV